MLDETPVLLGRHGTSYGSHVALYEPAFAYAVEALADLKHVAMSPKDGAFDMAALYNQFQNIISSKVESGKEDQYLCDLQPLIAALLDEDKDNVTFSKRYYTIENRRYMEADIVAECPTLYPNVRARHVAGKAKLWEGNGGQADLQTLLSHRKILGASDVTYTVLRLQHRTDALFRDGFTSFAKSAAVHP